MNLIDTFTLSTNNLQFFQLQEYMNQMNQDWNWARCDVRVENNEIIFDLYEEVED